MEITKREIGKALRYFETYFATEMQSHVPLMARILQYLEQRKGKQMRPMFVLLCARLGGELNPRSYRAALLVELLHTASLVHDDMVDDATERRGDWSVNALWHGRASVMVGDYLFAKGMLLSLSNEDHRILEIYAAAIGDMIESELLQLTRSRKPDTKEETYYNIIRAKTASFLAAACAAGASSTITDTATVNLVHRFGEKAGMAFQVKDDLFDYGEEAVGKPIGNDIKEKKITLPLIYTLNTANPALRKKIMHIVNHQNTDKDKVNEVVQLVRNNGGMQYAEAKMIAYRDEALELLYQFPASGPREALEELVYYITDRKY